MSPHVEGTTPYPWPYDGDLRGAGTALLVVAPASAVPAPEVADRVASLAAAVRGAGGAVITVATTAPAPGAAVTRGTPPTVPAPLTSPAADVALAAGGVDGFWAGDLDMVLRLRGVRRLLLAGVGLETSVHSTMRGANDRGYECLLVVDACEAVDPDLVPASVSSVEMSGGIFGAVGRTADVVAALAPAAAPVTTATTEVPVPAGAAPTSGDLP